MKKGTSAERMDLANFAHVKVDDLKHEIKKLQKQILDIEGKENDVSYSVIEVELTGSDYADFTVTDLPGRINNPGANQNREIGRRIDDLLQNYLQNPLCTNCTVMRATEDFHNLQILEQAFKYDESTERTLPVMTYADRVDDLKVENVIQLINGEETLTKYQLGFHLVSLCPGNRTEMELLQERFSKKTAQLAIPTEKLGVDNLREKLGNVYMDLLAKAIPDVKKRLQERLKEIEEELPEDNFDSSTQGGRFNIKLQMIDDVQEFANRLTTDMEHVDNNQFQTKDNVPLITVRASLENLKLKFAESIRPKEYGEIKIGDMVRIAFNGEWLKCKVLHIISELEEASINNSGYGSKTRYIITPEDDLKPSKWNDSYTDALFDNFRKPKQMKDDTREDIICCEDGKGKTYFGWLEGKPQFEKDYYRLRTFYEDDFKHDNATLIDELRSHQQKKMQIFEGEPVFNSHVQKWLGFTVDPACKSLITSVTEIVENQFMHFVEKNKLISNHPNLKNGLTKALAAAQSSLVIFLTDCLDQVIDTEWGPQTQNPEFTSIIRKLRDAPLLNMLLSGAQKETDDSQEFVPVDFIKKVFKSDDRMLLHMIGDDIAIALRAYFKNAHNSIVDTVAKLMDAVLEGAKNRKIRSLKGFVCQEVVQLDFESLLCDPGLEKKLKKLRDERSLLQEALARVPIITRQ